MGASLNPESSDLDNKTGLIHTAFVGARRLTEITVAEGNEFFVSFDGVLYRRLTVDDNIVAIDYLELVAYPQNKSAFEYVVEDGTLKIASYAFYNAANLEDVTLPDTLQAIGASAFENCDYLSRITFLSAQAPALEGFYDEANGVNYKNFVTGIDEGADFIRVIVPSNAIGYDTYVWTQYFAVIEASGNRFRHAEHAVSHSPHRCAARNGDGIGSGRGRGLSQGVQFPRFDAAELRHQYR